MNIRKKIDLSSQTYILGGMSGEEKRIHARVAIQGDVRASGPKGVESGTLIDISKGGAGLLLDGHIGDISDSVEIFIEFDDNLEIAVMAEILRTQEREDGVFHGVRFSLVEPALQERLIGVIEHLLTKKNEAGSRRYPRVNQHLPMKYGELGDLKAKLNNISMGGLAMEVEEPLVLYEEIAVSIPDPSASAGNRELLLLNGTVKHQQRVEDGDEVRYRVGLEFDNLSVAAKSCLRALLQHVAAVVRHHEK